jgi:hypothetical protein
MAKLPNEEKAYAGDGLSVGRFATWVVMKIAFADDRTPGGFTVVEMENVCLCQAVSAADVQVRFFVPRPNGLPSLDVAVYMPREKVMRIAGPADFAELEKLWPGVCKAYRIGEQP